MRERRQTEEADESWTEMEDIRPELVEAIPIRHGMVLGGRYTVEKIIGRGGSGVVVRAHDRDLKEAVAIKIVRAELAGERVWADRLAREVKLARQIQHPHICRVFDFEQADGRAFLVMELAGKGSLRDEIRSGTARTRPWAARITDARAVASALAAIHGAGIVHRDLTPQNLLRMADGRLVVSDFGLATDACEATTSVHGGTIAYMAPELVRGGRSSFASDIWALGVVMYELMFGERVRWQDRPTSELPAPTLGRKLTAEERAVLDVCRGCTANDPAKRIASAAEAGRRLTEGGGSSARRFIASQRRPIVVSAVLTLAVAAIVGVVRTRHETAVRAPAVQHTPLIVPTGEAQDWTNKSVVLADIPDRIACMVGLPDKRTIRFVWGLPRRAEDLDTRSGRRTPSPLVPEAYAEGCPDLSPDGERLVYPGHVPDGRAFAFVSSHPDGRDGQPIAATAEPTHVSEPKWLADGKSFSYDVDTRHMGIFSLETRRSVVIPEHDDDSHVSSFRWTMGDQLFVSKVHQSDETEFVGHQWPSLAEIARFRIAGFFLDLCRADESTYYFTTPEAHPGQVLAISMAPRSVRRIGFVREQFPRYLVPVDAGLSFVSVHVKTVVEVRAAGGDRREIVTAAYVRGAVRCGGDLLLAEETSDGSVIKRVSVTGAPIATLTKGPQDGWPSCSPDGSVWYYIRSKLPPGIVRCDDRGCRPIVNRRVMKAAVSPDGKRLVFLALERRGLAIYLSAADGTNVREVTETETTCAPGWSSPQTVWISRRHGQKLVWTEVDADSGRETGRVLPGTTDCTNGVDDSESPASSDVRSLVKWRTQVRLLAREYLPRH